MAGLAQHLADAVSGTSQQHQLCGSTSSRLSISVSVRAKRLISYSYRAFSAESTLASRTAAEREELRLRRGRASAAWAGSPHGGPNSDHEDAGKDMFYSFLWLAGGTAVTVITLMNAKSGGSYVVAWGAMLFGGIQFLRGLARSFG